ncbi:F0F1 ATP synthase subunit epsilon [Jejuia pallidilutea]|jgi:F-type H+-transporting ATPase subunit epsilon|uniref:ATP synthase epsilon chain n=1 Tax=Jejuia pallidilutea TaxID=504487 RepID=A0A090W2N0_9FLAO|nr:F0F1 ATP synthase subunit epsilon [Jejuia pallidilutea]PQV51773.1 F-type H+-transporting ATPase subunit epsilon [Jejuia pallidilutea]GAL66472.1 ATP synthase epsilon chain [Jejuia pallidilutea]GAL69729.1 ATP synthase epsilon chain [Jejuia pallidilutea]GAL87838.1 ATP synthase epsilon chain [Jejuia pallidilutea]
MYLEIVSPEATLFSGEVDAVAVPGVNGEFEILQNHAPIISLLKDGLVKISGNIVLDEEVAPKFTKTGKGFALSISSGTIEMKDNKLIVLAD